jgi:formylglycine-generating enzyme required for sulfatase activity
MDKTDVTNAEFARFVAATHYITDAERTPKPEDFPGAPPENLVPGAVVFSPPDEAVPLNNNLQWWSYVKGQMSTSEWPRQQHQRQGKLPGRRRLL